MSIDLESDRILSATAARQWLGDRTGVTPTATAFRRWVSTGIKGVVLESILVGGRKFTTLEALNAWIAATSGNKAPTTTARHRRRVEAEVREADRIFGIVREVER